MTFDEIKRLSDRLDSEWESIMNGNDGPNDLMESIESYVKIHEEYSTVILVLINEGKLYDYIEWRSNTGSRTADGSRVADED